jgi:hypothetical protein
MQENSIVYRFLIGPTIDEEINSAIDEAIGTVEIQGSLRLVVDDNKVSHDAVVSSLRQGIESILSTRFASDNSDEAARYAAEFTEARRLLDHHLATFPEYQAICSAEAEVADKVKQKMQELKQCEAERLAASTREAAVGSSPTERQGYTRIFFRRVAHVSTESEQLSYQCERMREELTGLRRRVADVATNRARFALRFGPDNPEFREQLKKVESARSTLRTAVVQTSLPLLKKSTQEYAELREVDGAGVRTESEIGSEPDDILSISDDYTSEGESDLTSRLEEAHPARSLGAIGPGDKRSVFLVHGRDTRAAKEMRIFLRALSLRVVEWESAIRETGRLHLISVI